MFKEFALAGVLSISAISSAYASTVSGSFSGTIEAPANATNSSIRYDGAGTNSLEWGTSSEKKKKVKSSSASSLTINDLSFSFDQDDLSSGTVLLGTITWVNKSNWNTGTSWSSQVNLDIDFFTPSAVSLSESVGFGITNTPDPFYDTKKNEKLGNNPDVITGFTLDSSAFGVPVSLGNGYKLTSIFFGEVDAGKGSTYDPVTGLWTNVEGGTSTIGIYGEISAVPLPAGLWLMLGGLGSFAAVRRRKKAA